jgi:hypothetical protein
MATCSSKFVVWLFKFLKGCRHVAFLYVYLFLKEKGYKAYMMACGLGASLHENATWCSGWLHLLGER